MNWRFEKTDEVTSEDLHRLQDRSLKFPKDRISVGKTNRQVISDMPPKSFLLKNEGHLQSCTFICNICTYVL